MESRRTHAYIRNETMKPKQHIERCRALYKAYYRKPTKANLRKLSDYLDVMKESKAESVKSERRKAMAFVRRESKHFTKKRLLENPSIKKSLMERYPQLDVEKLSLSDPSGKDKYLPWMAKMVVKNNEAPDAVARAAQEFHRNFQRLEKKDINQYNSYEDVILAVRALSPTLKEKRSTAEKGTRKIFEDDLLRVIEVTNKEAGIKYGKGTTWCISATKSKNFFNDYYWAGSRMFIFLPKDPRKEKITIRFDEDNQIIEIREPDQKKKGLTVDSIGYLHPRLRDILIKIKREELSNLSLPQKLIKGEASQEEFRAFQKHADTSIRRKVAKRIDPKYLSQMMKDSDKYVRREFAEHIDPKYLHQMMKDDDADVRYIVAKRIDPEYLPQMMKDSDKEVRWKVADRIDPKYLPQMMKDSDIVVRIRVARRIDPEYLPQMMKDSDANVRWEVADRMRTLGMKP